MSNFLRGERDPLDGLSPAQIEKFLADAGIDEMDPLEVGWGGVGEVGKGGMGWAGVGEGEVGWGHKLAACPDVCLVAAVHAYAAYMRLPGLM